MSHSTTSLEINVGMPHDDLCTLVPIYFLDWDPPAIDAGLDPRRRNLYGPFITWLSPHPTPRLDAGVSQGGLGKLIDITRRDRVLSPVNHPEYVDRIAAFVKDHREGVLVVGRHDLARSLLGTGIPFVFDPTDSAALFYWRRAANLALRKPIKAINSIRLWRTYRTLERDICREAALVITTGPADEIFLKRLVPEARLLRVGNGTDRLRRAPVVPTDDGATIGFHGGMNWEPNREAAIHLAHRIAPHLKRAVGRRVTVAIAGKPVPTELAQADGRHGVSVHGFVEDLDSFMAALSIYVMPMYEGSGVKNKLIEAMAMGLPVITNTLGAEALEPEGRSAVRIAKDDREIIDSIRDLLADPHERARMRKAARAHAEKYYVWRDHRERLHGALREAKAEGRL